MARPLASTYIHGVGKRIVRPRSAKRVSAMTVSRRNVLPFLTVAASAPALLWLTAARAQEVWREFRRDDLGFRVELPGEPEIEEEEDDVKDVMIRSFDARVDYEKILMGIHHVEYKDPVSPEEEFEALREGLRKGGFPPTREAALTINGFPAREFICEADDNINIIHRRVVMGRFTLGVGVAGEHEVHDSPHTRRFLDSFKLLRSAP
jgi:hypothetical protein